MAGKGKGFDYYRNTYTHEQLWEMLVNQGDAWSVEQAGTVWTSAKSGLETAREELNTSMLKTVDYWQGPASEEFQRRMRVVYEYSETTEESMMQTGEVTIPGIAKDLSDAQGKARSQNLDPSQELTYDDWLEEVKQASPEDPDYLDKQSQYQSEYDQYKTDRHDAMAIVVADLGDRYANYKADRELATPPPPPPSDMPGNSTYQPPTGGVFADNGLNSAGSMPSSPGSEGFAGAGEGGAGGDDLEPVEGWAPGSYGDIDSELGGGLASGGMVHGGPPLGGGSTVGTGGIGGTSVTGAGAGLFGPAKGGGGAGSTPGRSGANTNSPARSGATKSTSGPSSRSGSNPGGRGGSGRNMGRGMGPRGGTRSGYNDDDDEEETTRETWLREDDVNWGANRTPDEEVDD